MSKFFTQLAFVMTLCFLTNIAVVLVFSALGMPKPMITVANLVVGLTFGWNMTRIANWFGKKLSS